MLRKCFILLASLLLLTACTPLNATPLPDANPSPPLPIEEPNPDPISLVLEALSGSGFADEINEDLLRFVSKNFDEKAPEKILSHLNHSPASDTMFYDLFGISLRAISLLAKEEPAKNVRVMSTRKKDLTFAFTGDVCLDDTWYNMRFYQAQGYTIDTAFPGEIRTAMQSADILLINNEFCFSKRGTPIPGKQFTFRADPERVSILSAMGVDIVSLANNHAYDYGADAFTDTLSTLQEANIATVGAGETLAEAMTPQYFIAGGRVIAYVAATRAEKTILTPSATEHSSGVLRTYDPALFLQVIEEAEQRADFVIAYLHWGAENQSYLEPEIVRQAKQYIDAGADAVIGSHAHCLQGVDFYNGKPIIYNLGNFWFNLETVDAALFSLTLSEQGEVGAQMIPCLQTRATTSIVTDTTAGARILNRLRALSPAVNIDDEGYLKTAS